MRNTGLVFHIFLTFQVLLSQATVISKQIFWSLEVWDYIIQVYLYGRRNNISWECLYFHKQTGIVSPTINTVFTLNTFDYSLEIMYSSMHANTPRNIFFWGLTVLSVDGSVMLIHLPEEERKEQWDRWEKDPQTLSARQELSCQKPNITQPTLWKFQKEVAPSHL